MWREQRRETIKQHEQKTIAEWQREECLGKTRCENYENETSESEREKRSSKSRNGSTIGGSCENRNSRNWGKTTVKEDSI